MTHLFLVALACKIGAQERLAPTVDNTVTQSQSSRLLASAQSRTPTHYVENFFILRDGHNNEVTESVLLPSSIYLFEITCKIDKLYEKYKMPYIVSLYDVDDLESFRGIFLIVVMKDNINKQEEVFNPRLKVYSPIVRRVSTKYTVFTPPLNPQDSFITHISSDARNRKSLTQLFSKYNDYYRISVIFSELFNTEKGLVAFYGSNNIIADPESAFIKFIEFGDVNATNKKLILRRPRKVLPEYIIKIKQQANTQLALEQKEREVLEAAFACSGNPNLHTQLVEYFRFLCKVLQLLRTLPPVVRPTSAAPQSPEKLYHASLRKSEASLRSQARQQLGNMLPNIYKLTNYYLSNKYQRKLPFENEVRNNLANNLNDVLEETRKYFDAFKARIPPRILQIPYPLIGVLRAEKIIDPFESHEMVNIFLGEELEKAYLIQEIAMSL